ncbi:accessory factor UbiK family protein [Glycocaulis abyssi]|uniref:Accessory factor UbiK family protein n=1 Tax=Glycocaulis abyssi TaxID=1433403 RepID=A0ABV9NAV4_9PROT
MQTRNPVFTDLADLMTDAFGAARAAGDEARSVFRAQAERVAADMDLASGDEMRALQAIIARQGEEIESLKARLAALEGKKPATSRAAAAPKRKPASKKASS